MMHSLSLVSVIIPAYNAEKTIKATMQSVLKQTYDNIELLIINDGSTDSTPEIVRTFKDPRIRLYDFTNAGLSAARNRGIARATGEYISFIDADDMWSKDKIESHVQALKDNPSAAVVYSWSYGIYKGTKKRLPDQTYRLSGDVYREMLCINFVAGGSNILAKKEAIEKTGKFDETLTACEDWDYYIRLAREYEFAHIPKFQVFRSITRDNMSSNFLAMEKNALKVIEKNFSDVPRDEKKLKILALIVQFEYLAGVALRANFSRKNVCHAIRFALKWGILYPVARIMCPKELASYMHMYHSEVEGKRFRLLVPFIFFVKITLTLLLPQKWAEAILKRQRE